MPTIRELFITLSELFRPGLSLANRLPLEPLTFEHEVALKSFCRQLVVDAERVLDSMPPRTPFTKSASGAENLFNENVLQEANRLVSTDRLEDYPDATKACSKVALMWEAILGTKVRPEDVPLMMVCFKVVREVSKHKRGHLVDIAGYSRVAEMVIEGAKQ